MLQLVLGRKKSGKTQYCHDLAEKLVKTEKQVVFLVPEQFSFECQRNLLKILGSKTFNKIDILSFTGLCNEIQAKFGGFSGINVDEGTRFALIGQALNSVKDNLKIYGKYYNSSAFIKELMNIITEFKQNGINSENLNDIAKITENINFSNKLFDLGLILSAYDAQLKSKFSDPLDLIERTLNIMQDNLFFKNKIFIIDEFKGFTEVQFKLLERIIAGSDDTYVTLCCDSLTESNDTDIFKNIKKSGTRLVDIAQSHLVEVREPVLLSNQGVYSDDIEALEQLLSDKPSIINDIDAKNITVCRANNTYNEIEFCMSEIRRLVREEKYRYRDFVIISRNDSYKNIIKDTAEIYDIPIFTDNRFSVSELPLSVFLTSAIKSAISMNTEDILKMLKTGLCGLDLDSIIKLENYAYIWNIDGNKWLDDWNMSAKGFKSVDISKEDAEKLILEAREINEIRKQVIKPLETLRFGLNGTAESICRAILRFLEDCNTIENLKNLTSKLELGGNLVEAEYQISGYDAIVKTFDKIVTVLGDREIKGREFLEIMSSILSFETVGEIPQTKDHVMYGTADHIRTFRPKVTFVIGINQDVFPATLNDDGLLSQFERDVIISNGFKISDLSISDCLDEKFLFYLAVTSSFDKVYLSYSECSISGSGLEPSLEIETILNRFSNLNIVNASNYFYMNNVETKEATFRKLAENYNEDSDLIGNLKGYFSNEPEFKDRIKAIDNYITEKPLKLSKESALGLYGDEIRLSASKTNDFAGCKFLYFCKYGLGVSKREKADFDPLTRGNIVHYCLEKFVEKHLNDIGSLLEDDIAIEVTTLCDEYIELTVDNADKLDEKFNYMLQLVKDTVIYLTVSLNSEFKQSDFKPKFCELNVGDGEAIPGIDVITDSGNRVTLKGYIDRVDTTSDGKIRVVDYKTGSKGDSFKLSEILNGRDLQMLLYLYSCIKNGEELLKATVPAGVLYFPAKRQATDSKSEYIKMSGLLLDEESTLRQMEQSLDGKIIPAHIRPNGSSFYSTESMVSENAFKIIFKYLEVLLSRIGSSIMRGEITPEPLKVGDKSQCKYCDYRAVCRISPQAPEKQGLDCKNSEALTIIEEEMEKLNGN